MSPENLIILITWLCGSAWILVVILIRAGLGRLINHHNPDQPQVSVLVAARNEAGTISACLEALKLQDYPPDKWELIVIDDNSEDATAQTAESYAGTIRNFAVIPAGKTPEGIAPKKHALMAGIRKATGDVVLTTDADCQPLPGWISGMIRLFTPGIKAVAGFSPLHGKGSAGAVGRFDGFVNAVVAAGAIGSGRAVTAVGRNFAYRKSAWLECGGFGTAATGASGDDDLLVQRIAGSGGGVVFSLDPETFVSSSAQDSIGAWWRMKRRHLSAGRRYSPLFVLLSVVLYLFQVGLVAGFGMVICGYPGWWMPAAAWAAKSAADGAVLAKGARLLRFRGWLFSFLIAEIVSPLLFTVMLPTVLFGRIRWKGRALHN